MAKFGPEYEKQAVEVKRGLFENFITTHDVPTTLLEVGAGTLPNAAYYTVSMPGSNSPLLQQSPLRLPQSMPIAASRSSVTLGAGVRCHSRRPQSCHGTLCTGGCS